MNLLNATILGIVEGITEFLPISSTAHLIITSKFLHIPQTDFQKFFEVFIQSGAILAVVFLYISYVKKHTSILKNLVFSFIPTAVVGFILYKVIKTIFFNSIWLIVGTIVIMGLIFIILEYFIKTKKHPLKKSVQTISPKNAFLIGLAQAIAVIPGISRSGIVMVAMMVMGYKRDESASYSFLLAVPTILAASVFDVYKTKSILLSRDINVLYLFVGFITSFVTAYISIKLLVDFLQKHSLTVFGLYRLILALFLLAYRI